MTELSFQRHENTGPVSSLWRVDEICAFEEGNPVGTIRISYVPADRIEHWHNDIYEFLGQRGGAHGLPRVENISEASQEALAGLVYHLHDRLEGYTKANARKWHTASLSELKDALAQWRDRVEGVFGEKREEFINFHVDKPLVDFIEIQPDFRGRRLSRQLYQEAAQWMSERDLHLHASGAQTDAAKAAWTRMEQEEIVADVPDGRRVVLAKSARP